jgi:predicted metal-dependent hydrolase
VIVHELCHLIELNHSKRFWALVSGVLPEYRKEEQWLKTQGMLIMRKMTG